MSSETATSTIDDLRLFRAFLDETSDAIYIIDPETGKFLDANKCAWQNLGYTREELLNMNVVDLNPELAGRQPFERFVQVVRERGEITVEGVHKCKDGTTVPVEVNLRFTQFDKTGYLIAVARDITERKQAREVEQLVNERLRAIFDSAMDAIILMDQEGLVVLWNQAAENMFGYSAFEAVGKDCHSMIMPETYREVFVQAFDEFRRTGTGAAIGRILELEAKHKSGSLVPVELSISAVRLGGHPHAVEIVRDITERQRSDQLFQQTVFRYAAMLDTVPAMVYLKDIDHRYVAVNKAFRDIVGKTSREIIGKTVYDILQRDVADEYHKADKAVMDGDHRVDDHEKQIRNDNGDTMWISTTKVPLHDSQGLVNGMVGLVQDVSDIHRSREQLVQSDKLAAIGTLAAGVAHEINNPIGFINSNLNTMQKYLQRTIEHIESLPCDDDTLNEEMKDITSDFGEAIEESIEGAGRIRDIVADLKSFSRVDKAGRENANLNDGIQSTLNIVWNELKYKCKVEKELGDIPDIYCMANQLNQVFMNLLMNAGHAITHDHGLIKIKTWADDSNVYVSIADNGTGIPRENMGKLFEPFFTTKDVGKGTGLGLSLAFDIVKKHGGQIDVKSEVGQGAEFTISLPLEGIKDE